MLCIKGSRWDPILKLIVLCKGCYFNLALGLSLVQQVDRNKKICYAFHAWHVLMHEWSMVEHTNFIHASLNYLHLLSCHIVNGMSHETESTEQTSCKQWQLSPCSKEAHTCLGLLKYSSHSWEEREGHQRERRWPHSDTCALWDFTLEQFGDEENTSTKPLSSICFHHPCTHVSLMTSEKLSFWLWGIT